MSTTTFSESTYAALFEVYTSYNLHVNPCDIKDNFDYLWNSVRTQEDLNGLIEYIHIEKKNKTSRNG